VRITTANSALALQYRCAVKADIRRELQERR